MADPSRSPKKISVPEMGEALGRSGYLLESRIERVLRSARFDVEPSWTYPDPETRKARELDLVASCDMWLDRGSRFHWVGYEMFIECVNNAQPLVFFTRDDPDAKSNGDAVFVRGQPLGVNVNKKKEQRVPKFLKFEEFHHYARPKYATQYCSFAQKKGTTEWVALHDENHFLSLKKLDDAIWYCWEKTREEEAEPGQIDLTFMYPVVVLQGELLEVNPWSRRSTPRKTGHVRFTQTVIHDDEQYLLNVDVVTERSFRKYLRMLGDEYDEIYRRVALSGDVLIAAATCNLAEDEAAPPDEAKH
jgi:hypothetical protein